MTMIEINGVTIVCEDSGGDARALVLVHGFTGNRGDFRDHYAALSEIGRTVVYDHRGHGESTNTGEASTYSFDQLVADLDALLDRLGVTRCDLLGHSMGGMVALRYVLAHPERVSSLILMDTAARAPDGFLKVVFEMGAEIGRSEGMEKLAETARAMAEKDPNRTAASRAYQTRIGSEAYWKRHFQRMAAMDAEAFGMLGAELSDQQPTTERLGEIQCPTTILVGEQDVPFLEPSREMQAGIPDATRVVIAEAAHSPQLENPGAWFDALCAHLARVR